MLKIKKPYIEKLIVIITPTYERLKRIEYIKRCIRVFKKIENILWIVVEDACKTNNAVEKLLKTSGIKHIYLAVGPTRDKGNAQRNLALDYSRDVNFKGVIYLADDDNLYDKRLFDEIRKTKKVSVFPVGNLGPGGIERPIVKNGRIAGWDAGRLERKFPIDMAGFAFDSDKFRSLEKSVWFFNIYGGETELLERLVNSYDELELLCSDCTKCYVWHNQPLGKNMIYNKLKMMIKSLLPASILNFIQRLNCKNK